MVFAAIASLSASKANSQWIQPPQQTLAPYASAAAAPYGGTLQSTAPAAAPYVPPIPAWDAYAYQPGTRPGTCAPAYPLVPVVPQTTSHFHLFGEFLYLRPNDAALVSYGLPVNGLLPPPLSPVPAGPVAIVDPSYEPGFRVGGGVSWSAGTEILGTYTRYRSDTSSSVAIGPPSPNVILPLVFHPATLSAGTTYTSAAAQGDISLDIVDIDYRRSLAGDWLRTSYYLGGRYVNLDQSFSAQFTGGVAPGPALQNVNTKVDFKGGGIRAGLSADLTRPQSGLFGYGKGFLSFIAGEFDSSFRQTDGGAVPIVIASTSRTDDRMVPVVDIELGVGWQSQGGGLRFTAGYLFSTWFNVVSTDEFIKAAHTAQFSGLSDSLTFDGLTARVDWRF